MSKQTPTPTREIIKQIMEQVVDERLEPLTTDVGSLKEDMTDVKASLQVLKEGQLEIITILKHLNIASDEQDTRVTRLETKLNLNIA